LGSVPPRAKNNNNIIAAITLIRPVERGEGKGKVFPGLATFGGPAVAQNTEKGVPDGYFLT